MQSKRVNVSVNAVCTYDINYRCINYTYTCFWMNRGSKLEAVKYHNGLEVPIFAERRIVSSSSDYLPPRCPGSTEWVPERKEENEKSIANVSLF